MWPYSSVGLGLLLLAVNSLQESCSPKACKDSENGRSVCGSDGITYYSRCHLERARCHNKELLLKHRGPCTSQRPCLAGLEYANSHSQNTFKPQCRPDGTYAASQCHPDAGFCWCVTPEGTPVPNTSVRYSATAKPKCTQRKTTNRRSSRKSGKIRRNCKTPDRATFNNNLIKIFYTEYNRERGNSFESNTNGDRAVLEWKFKGMDQDHNDLLDKTEYRDLRKIVKKAVKPKRCAKTFSKACDMNHDQQISRQEWMHCINRDGMDEGRTEGGPKNSEDESDDADVDDDDEEVESVFASPRSPPHGVLYSGARISGNGQGLDEESGERRDEEPSDCLSDRLTAQNEQRADQRYVQYIPECTPDGRYQKIQCYKSAGYCWCVNEDTGKNIPGTSVKNQVPKCDQIPLSSRPMKGCPDEKKFIFLKDLMAFFHARMLKETNGTGITGNGPAWKASKEEQIGTWSFVVFDKNKNKLLDKSEWKAFKDAMVAVKSLKRCGRKLPRYCDINKDRQISMTEWLDCLNAQRNAGVQNVTFSSPPITRTGTNPSSLLMED